MKCSFNMQDDMLVKMNENTEAKLYILFIFICFILAVLMRKFNDYSGIPYCPMMFLIGLLWGISSNYTGSVGILAIQVTTIRPVFYTQNTLLQVFIPGIVFQAAYHSDWNQFKNNIAIVAFLAGPAVIFSAVLIGALVLYVLNYDWLLDWSHGMLLGSVLGATDTVAVLAIMKEISTTSALTTIIEGESLFNDATALMLYTISMSYSEGISISLSSIALIFLRLTTGGIVFGLILSIMMLIWIKSLEHDYLSQFLVTFFTSYLGFYMCEYSSLKVSGILYLLSSGCIMSLYIHNKLSSRAQDFMDYLWSFIAFASETYIFVISGIMIGSYFLEANISGIMYVKLIVFYLCVIGIRVIMVGISYPLLRRNIDNMTWKEAAVIINGGLMRGGISLTLAVSIFTKETLPQEIKIILLFFTAGIVLLTIVINGTTIKLLFKRLGIESNQELTSKLIYTRTLSDDYHQIT